MVIADGVAKSFEPLEIAVTEELSAVIDERQRQIEQTDEHNQREAEDRDRAIAALIDAAEAVAKTVARFSRRLP